MTKAIIPTDAPSVFDALDGLPVLRRRAILRPNNPPAGIAGFVFDITLDEELRLRSQISQNYIESNTPIVDNIALEPERFTMRGMIAEVPAYLPTTEPVAKVDDPLGDNPDLIPELTEFQVQELMDDVEEQQIIASDAQSLYGFFGNRAPPAPGETRQARMVAYIQQLWWGRQVMTVETPWGFLVNMAIEDATISQGEDTNGWSTCSITFQKVRFVEEASVNVGQLANRIVNQMASTTNNGNAGKTDVTPAEESSILYDWSHPSK